MYMKEKKKAKDWYIAATHYLTAGFIVPFLCMVVIGTLLAMLDSATSGQLPSILYYVIVGLFSILFIYLGVIYSAKFIGGRYSISDASKIVRLSTIYSIIISVVFTVLDFIFPDVEYRDTTLEIVLSLTISVVAIAVFYFASRKFVKANV